MHTANTLAYFKNFLSFKKIYIISEFEKEYILAWISQRKNHFLYFWILQHVCKIQRVLANIQKNIKTFFGDSYYSLSVFG